MTKNKFLTDDDDDDNSDSDDDDDEVEEKKDVEKAGKKKAKTVGKKENSSEVEEVSVTKILQSTDWWILNEISNVKYKLIQMW